MVINADTINATQTDRVIRMTINTIVSRLLTEQNIFHLFLEIYSPKILKGNARNNIWEYRFLFMKRAVTSFVVVSLSIPAVATFNTWNRPIIIIRNENTLIIFEINNGKFLLFASKRADKRKKARNTMFLTKSKTASEIFTALKRDNPE